LAMLSYQSRRHLRVAINRLASEALLLKPAGAAYSFADFGRAFGRLLRRQLADFHGWHVDVDVDAVEQRAGDALLVARDDRGRADTLALGVPGVAAGAGMETNCILLSIG